MDCTQTKELNEIHLMSIEDLYKECGVLAAKLQGHLSTTERSCNHNRIQLVNSYIMIRSARK